MLAQGGVATSICDCSISVMTRSPSCFCASDKKFLVRAAHRMARFRVEQEVFLFHPERVHARDNRPGGTLFRYRFDAKMAAAEVAAAADNSYRTTC